MKLSWIEGKIHRSNTAFHHHHHHYIALLPNSGPGLPLWGFVTVTVLQGWIFSPAPNPPTWRARPPYLWPPATGWPGYTRDYTALYPRWLSSAYSLSWDPEISYGLRQFTLACSGGLLWNMWCKLTYRFIDNHRLFKENPVLRHEFYEEIYN
jgi:hypothetical protein